MSDEIKRRMSLESDFMDHKTDDLIYGFMRCLSTSKKNEGEIDDSRIDRVEYLTFKEFTKYKKTLAGVCDCSARTINRRIDQLEETGLIKVVTIQIQNEQNKQTYDYPSYIFPYDYDGNYKLVSKDMLKYLVNTRNKNVIRVYLFLLNRFEWKPNYVFTIEEIKSALDFKMSYQLINEVIRDILNSLSREGIITFEQKWFPIENNVGGQTMTQRMVLTNVLKEPPLTEGINSDSFAYSHSDSFAQSSKQYI